MNKKTSLYLYILIAVFTVFVGASTYAFFAGNNNIDAKANLSAETGKTYTFTSTSATNFELNLTSADMQQSQSGNYVSSTVGTIDVSLTSPEGKNTTCTFDLLFTWTSSSKYTTPNVTLPYTSGSTTYNCEFSTLVKDGDAIAFAERDLSKANNGAGFGSGLSGTIAENLSLSANGGTINKTYSIEARIYNLPVNQPNLIGKNMKASVKVDNLNCEYGSPTGEGTIYAMMKNASSSDASINFGVAPTASTSGVYLRSTTTSDEYPVYYYRGIVDNNNLIFDNFCWKIVRTTENAGIKLVYNGVPTADGSCNNTGTASQLESTSKFNNKSKSPADVGYMYGDRYEAVYKSMSSQSGTYIYGNNVSYSNGVYTLINTYSSTSWSSDITTLANGYHYTCFGTGNTCTGSVYYIYYFGSTSYTYYLTLNGERDIEEVKENMFRNENDSTIKGIIDDWYEDNIKDKESKLEDAVWCNDRRITSGPLVSKDTGGTGSSYFGAYYRNYTSPYSLPFSCDKNDAFTQNESAVGNGALDNRVGLLTADEYTLAGSGYNGYSESSYLNTGQYQWSLSPYVFYGNGANGFYLASSSDLAGGFVDYAFGARPAISLKPGTKVTGDGDGSTANPYIVE